MIKSLKSIAILLFIVVGFLIGKTLYMKPSYSGGEIAPAFNSTLLNGTSFSIEELKGKFVLLDFWGSWCLPCRHENPTLIEFANKYRFSNYKDAKGFEVVSVAIETKRRENSWKKAIRKDGLKWPYHILDEAESLRFFDSPIAKLYGVKEVPTKFLLNPKGEIIGVNLSFAEMDELLAQSLTK